MRVMVITLKRPHHTILEKSKPETVKIIWVWGKEGYFISPRNKPKPFEIMQKLLIMDSIMFHPARILLL